MNNDLFKQVTPRSDYSPDRTHKRVGAIVSCYRVISCQDFSNEIKAESTPAMVVKMSTVNEAKMLMKDLYYGEYTGA